MQAGESYLQWSHADLDWNGRYFRLTIPHYISEWAAGWLKWNLADRLGSIPELRGVPVEVTNAVRTTEPNSTGWNEAGEIVIGGFEAPFPDVGELVEAVVEAEAEARRATEEAETNGRAYLQGLRSWLTPPV